MLQCIGLFPNSLLDGIYVTQHCADVLGCVSSHCCAKEGREFCIFWGNRFCPLHQADTAQSCSRHWCFVFVARSSQYVHWIYCYHTFMSFFGREKGGAYGGGSSMKNSLFSFYSYRSVVSPRTRENKIEIVLHDLLLLIQCSIFYSVCSCLNLANLCSRLCCLFSTWRCTSQCVHSIPKP